MIGMSGLIVRGSCIWLRRGMYCTISSTRRRHEDRKRNRNQAKCEQKFIRTSPKIECNLKNPMNTGEGLIRNSFRLGGILYCAEATTRIRSCTLVAWGRLPKQHNRLLMKARSESPKKSCQEKCAIFVRNS